MMLTWGIALVALVIMVVGELWRIASPGPVGEAPLSQSTAVALAMATAWAPLAADAPDPGAVAGLVGPLLLCTTAVLAVALARRQLRHVRHDLTRLVVPVVLAGLLVRLPLPGAETLIERTGTSHEGPVVTALMLLAVAVVAVTAPVLLRAVRRGLAGHEPLRTSIVVDVGRHGPVALATASTAVVMALALSHLGPASLLIALVPLLVLQPAVARQRRIRLAQRQTVFALARLPEEAGLTAIGHGARVAALAVPVARELGVEGADLPDVEAAALLHDIGQVGLSRPVPGGATVEVSGRDQRQIAAIGSAILARTAELSRLATVVADVGVSHHRALERGDVSVVARILRVVSAYDDLTGRATRLTGGGSPIKALDRIQRSTPHEYDPLVVDALVRQLERRGVLSPAQGALLRT